MASMLRSWTLGTPAGLLTGSRAASSSLKEIRDRLMFGSRLEPSGIIISSCTLVGKRRLESAFVGSPLSSFDRLTVSSQFVILTI